MAEKSGFVWYDLMTTDLDAAIAFYKSVVGWDTHDSGMPSGMRYEIVGKDGKDVGGMMQWPADRPGMAAMWVGHIGTKDVKKETEAVAADGGSVHRPPTEIPGVGTFSVVGDPQGAMYQLFQPNREYAPERLPHNAVGTVSWHELSTTDPDAAWEFYSKHYGWEKDHSMDMGAMGKYQMFKTDKPFPSGGMMTIAPQSGMKSPQWLHYFQVDAAGAAAERVKNAGGSVLHGPAEVPGPMWIVLGIDPQGAMFAVVAEEQ